MGARTVKRNVLGVLVDETDYADEWYGSHACNPVILAHRPETVKEPRRQER